MSGYSSGSLSALDLEAPVIATWGGRRRRLRANPADELPPLAPLEELLRRARWRAEEEWRDEHGELPWEWPLPPLWSVSLEADREVAEAMLWPGRWFRDHLFELPPLGAVPERWHLLGPSLEEGLL